MKSGSLVSGYYRKVESSEEDSNFRKEVYKILAAYMTEQGHRPKKASYKYVYPFFARMYNVRISPSEYEHRFQFLAQIAKNAHRLPKTISNS